MNNIITNLLRSNIWYAGAVVLVLAWFTWGCYTGSKFFPDSAVQKNAGYSGPVPHSGYGVRFYHK